MSLIADKMHRNRALSKWSGLSRKCFHFSRCSLDSTLLDSAASPFGSGMRLRGTPSKQLRLRMKSYHICSRSLRPHLLKGAVQVHAGKVSVSNVVSEYVFPSLASLLTAPFVEAAWSNSFQTLENLLTS